MNKQEQFQVGDLVRLARNVSGSLLIGWIVYDLENGKIGASTEFEQDTLGVFLGTRNDGLQMDVQVGDGVYRFMANYVKPENYKNDEAHGNSDIKVSDAEAVDKKEKKATELPVEFVPAVVF